MYRIVTISLAFLVLSNSAIYACGGGGAGFRMKMISMAPNPDKIVSGMSTLGSKISGKNYTAVSKAIFMAPDYTLQAIANGDTPESHRQAAYEWGYAVGNPKAIGFLRTNGELAQAAYYTLTRSKKYTPLSLYNDGGLVDSIGDVVTAMEGAADKQAGRPSKF